MTFVRRLTLLWTRFSPLEKRLLAEVRNALPAAARPIYDQQVAAIKRVQRHPRWTEICFYPKIRLHKKPRVDWHSVPSFPCTDEFPLAQVRFSISARPYKATLTSINGHIFDFAVTPSPKEVAFVPWDAGTTVQLLDDPLRTSTGKGPREKISAAWGKFLSQHSQKEIAGGTLYDENTAYRVPSDNGQYLLLAERNGDEFILQNVEPDEGSPKKLLYLASHDGTPEPISGTLDDLIKAD